MLRRMALLARLRAEVEQGSSPAAVMASSGKSLFWKEKDEVGRQLGRWRADLLAKAMARLLEAERQVKASGGIGPAGGGRGIVRDLPAGGAAALAKSLAGQACLARPAVA